MRAQRANQANFERAKASVLHFAELLRRTSSPQELRARMLADVRAPYHSFDMLSLLSFVERLGEELAELSSEGLDADGAPE